MVGGAVGAAARYLLTHFSSELTQHHGFPVGTLLVNVIGSFAAGYVLTWSANHTHWVGATRGPQSSMFHMSESLTITVEPAEEDDVFTICALESDPDTRDYILPDSREQHAANLRDPDMVYLRILRGQHVRRFFHPEARLRRAKCRVQAHRRRDCASRHRSASDNGYGAVG